jgi:pyruvate formate lyase activating enzyme
MKIGGLQPVTLLDYPHKVAAIIFASGCNMRCPFCYNSNLVWPEQIRLSQLLEKKQTLDFLARRKKYLEGVVITGGEPTLQPGLPAFCRKLKKLGYEIKLDTNGLRPEVLSKLLSAKLVDYIAMDIKGPLGRYKKFCGVAIDAKKIRASIKLVLKSGLPYEFRSTLVKGLHTVADVAKMARAIKGASLYYLQNYHDQARPLLADFKGVSFFNKEMEEFKKIAGEFVKECKVR